MRRRSLIAAIPVLALSAMTGITGAQAAGKPASKAAANSGQHLDISPVALPVVVGERVLNYIFVEVRLNLTPLANLAKLQAMEPFFRDALVRAGHRKPFTRKDDYLSLDEARLKAALLTEAQRLGGKDVVGVTVMAQTPKRRTGIPTPPKA